MVMQIIFSLLRKLKNLRKQLIALNSFMQILNAQRQQSNLISIAKVRIQENVRVLQLLLMQLQLKDFFLNQYKCSLVWGTFCASDSPEIKEFSYLYSKAPGLLDDQLVGAFKNLMCTSEAYFFLNKMADPPTPGLVYLKPVVLYSWVPHGASRTPPWQFQLAPEQFYMLSLMMGCGICSFLPAHPTLKQCWPCQPRRLMLASQMWLSRHPG